MLAREVETLSSLCSGKLASLSLSLELLLVLTFYVVHAFQNVTINCLAFLFASFCSTLGKDYL
jgi:hypothetical protein